MEYPGLDFGLVQALPPLKQAAGTGGGGERGADSREVLPQIMADTAGEPGMA